MECTRPIPPYRDIHPSQGHVKGKDLELQHLTKCLESERKRSHRQKKKQKKEKRKRKQAERELVQARSDADRRAFFARLDAKMETCLLYHPKWGGEHNR